MKTPLPLLVSGLGIAQIVSWSSLYYLIFVPGDSMQRELGVPGPVLLAAFTLGLLISGMAAPTVGRLMEAHGHALCCAAVWCWGWSPSCSWLAPAALQDCLRVHRWRAWLNTNPNP